MQRHDEDRTARVSRVSAAAVARASGVSTATVSYVFNDRPGVSIATRRRVLATAAEMGYARRAPAKDPSRSRIVGLVLSDIANPFYPELSTSFAEAAQQRGYQVFLSHTHDSTESLSAAVSALLDRDIDGVAMTVARSDNAVAVRQLRHAKVPLVQLSRRFSHVDADFVGIDDRRAAEELMRHALQHQRWPLATVTGPRTSSASAQREQGFLQEAQRAGVSVPGSHRVSTDLTIEGGYRAAEHLFSQAEPPRFVVCSADAIALGVMSRARELGFGIPGDVAVMGFDGIEIAHTPMIGLTGVVQPQREMARRAFAMLIDHIEHPERPSASEILPHEFRIGTSCGCSPKGHLRP